MELAPKYRTPTLRARGSFNLGVEEAMQSVPVHGSLLAVDIEKSTSALGTHPIKEELRQEACP